MRRLKKRIVSGVVAAVILFADVGSAVSVTGWAAGNRVPGDSVLVGVEDHFAYCIDSYELLGAAGGIMGGVNEEYTYVQPTTKLSNEECAILFWGTLSMLASMGNQECATVRNKINAQAPSMGLPALTPMVTEQDLKLLIHLETMKRKYPWLNAVVEHGDSYMEMAGLKGSGGSSMGGKTIPAVLQGHVDPSGALAVDKKTLAISFDSSGADREFIQKVPIQFSQTGGEPWSASPVDGWTYQKTDTAILFSNPNPNPPKMVIRFNPEGTEFQKGSGYASQEDLFDRAMELWVCTRCSGLHVYHPKPVMPLESHQRMVNLNLQSPAEQYYAVLAGEPADAPAGSAGISFRVYRHEETMISTYNIQFHKYDHETGKPLEHAAFKLYERFDDREEINRNRDGEVQIYEGGAPYKSYHGDSPVVWDDFRFISGMASDENGYSAKTVNHSYHYDKTFCDGHPAPGFVSVPDEEYDEEGNLINEGEIDAAQSENMRMAGEWLNCHAACQEHSSGDFKGVHFHWLMPEVDMGEISSIRGYGGSPGDRPDAGKTTSASPDESYQESGCQTDCQETYDKFISLKYSYALIEEQARPGYVLHGVHADDLPIEVVTTDASEHGANAAFAGEYSGDITINDGVAARGALEVRARREKTETLQLEQMLAVAEKREQGRELIRKERSSWHQNPLRYLLATPGNASEELLIDDTDIPQTASPSNVMESDQETGERKATPSNAVYQPGIQFSRSYDSIFMETEQSAEHAAGASGIFTGAYNTALHGADYGADTEPGPDDEYSHCNDRDGEGDAWRIYDHRTEGELHINKRDMELEAGETEDYSSYGDSQGDGTLEGAVYGLFAAADILHPDGRTGVVYRANNLVAVAATDRYGDASFLANTEAPGRYYDYETGGNHRYSGRMGQSGSG